MLLPLVAFDPVFNLQCLRELRLLLLGDTVRM